MEVDRVEARWKGTTDLDTEAVKAMRLDGLMFFIVGVRTEQMGATRIAKDGQTVRKDIFDVIEARALLGDHRSQAVDFLSGEPSLEEITGRMESFEEPPSDSNDLSDGNFVAISVPVPPIAVDQEVRMAEDFEAEGVIGSLYDYKATSQTVEPMGGGGPKVAKFERVDDAPETVKTVGEGRKYKDKALARFMED